METGSDVVCEPRFSVAAAAPSRNREVQAAAVAAPTSEASSLPPGTSEELAWATFDALQGKAPSPEKKARRIVLNLSHYKNSLLITGETIAVREFLKYGGFTLQWNKGLRGWIAPFSRRNDIIKMMKKRSEEIQLVIGYDEAIDGAKHDAECAGPSRKRPRELSLWEQLAGDCTTEAQVRSFFQARQSSVAASVQKLRICRVVKVENFRSLKAFVTAAAYDADPKKAYAAKAADTLLFHGCPQTAATNIQAEGLSLKFASPGMLGKGLYGAPDPRKSFAYVETEANPNGNFMFICRFNLSEAEHAGPDTYHRNSVFDEFCVDRANRVVVLWMLKVELV